MKHTCFEAEFYAKGKSRMSLLMQIEKMGISAQQLAELKDRDLIRIEKKLKAEARMNPDFDSNAVVQILSALKNHKEELKLFYQDAYKFLREIINCESGYVLFTAKDVPENVPSPEMVAFIGANFSGELKRYANRCMVDDHFRALNGLLCFHACLDSELKDELTKKLGQKLNFLVEVIRIRSQNLSVKIEAAMNPYFYRCLNQLGGIQFGDEVSDLLNDTVDFLRRDTIHLRILYAMGSFKAVSENLKEVLTKNALIAARSGIGEKKYGSNENGKGGTYKRSANTAPRPPQRRRKGNSEGVFILRGLGVAGFILYVIFKILSVSKSANNNDYDYDYLNDQLYERIQNQSNRYEDPVPEAFHWDPSFWANLKYIHVDSCDIISKRKILFDITETNFKNRLNPFNPPPNNLQLINHSKRNIVVHVEGQSSAYEQFVFLEPEGSQMIPYDSRGIRIYTGENPQMVKYVDRNGDTVEYFSFAKFGADDLAILDQLRPIDQFFENTDDLIGTIEPDLVGLSFTVVKKVGGGERDKFRQDVLRWQDETNTLLEEENIEFDMTQTNLKKFEVIGYGKPNVWVENNTRKPIVLYFSAEGGGGHMFLASKEKKVLTTLITGLVIYTGKEPQMIKVKDKIGRELEGFRFKKFTDKDRNTMNKYSDMFLKLDSYHKYTLDLSEKNGEVDLEVVKADKMERLNRGLAE